MGTYKSQVPEPVFGTTPAPTAAATTTQPVTNPNGGSGGQPLQLASSAPAADRRNPNNAKALPPALPPVTAFPGVGAFANPNQIQNPNTGQARQSNGFKPTTAPFGFDQTMPGVEEQMWANNQDLWFKTPGVDWVNDNMGQFQDPWTGEQTNQRLLGTIAQPGQGQDYWAGIQGGMNQPTAAEQAISGGYRGPNNAQTAFDAMQGRIPGSLQPQWDAYYDRMAQKNMANVNAQSAARGSYGSNAALNGAIGAGLDAEALRAKDSAQFALDDSANQRAWMDSYSTAGRNADLSGQSQFQSNLDAAKYGLDKTKAYGDLAFRAEEMGFNKNKALSDIAFGIDEAKGKRLQQGADIGLAADQVYGGRLSGAFGAAGNAQNAYENRVNNLYDKNADMSEDVMQFAEDNYDKLLNSDGTVNTQGLEVMMAQLADQRGWSEQQREAFMRDVSTMIEGYAATQGKKGG